MQHYNKTHKCCATCANWSGPRRVIGTSVKQVEVSSANEHAKCYDDPRKGGFYDGPSADWGSSCSGYRTWQALN